MVHKIFNSVVLAVLIGAATILLGQDSSVIIDRDIRVFTTVSALNAAGFDVELASQYHPVRARMREHLVSLDDNLRTRLHQFYTDHKGDEPHEAQLAKYISLALSLTDPPDMHFALEEEFIPPDARELANFLPLLREFYLNAGITPLWSNLSGEYEGSLDALGPTLRDIILRTDAFLRVPLGRSQSRQLVIFQELTLPINSVNVRNYQDNLYIVFGHSTEVPAGDVRHAYLHLLLDPLVTQHREDLRSAGTLALLVEGVEGIRPQFLDDFAILATESLIRAAEIRMDRLVGIRAKEELDHAYRRGMLLAPFFHEALEEFLEAEAGIQEYISEMIESIDVDAEKERFEDRFQHIEVPREVESRAEVPPSPVAPNPVREILQRAQAAFNSGDDEKAHAEFERVMVEFDQTNGPALYGLALLASRKGEAVLAESYFIRTIQSQTAEPGMIVWSHIFLGRIYDIRCQRDDALEQYREAVQIADDSQGAQANARAGLDSPFGGGCR